MISSHPVINLQVYLINLKILIWKSFSILSDLSYVEKSIPYKVTHLFRT